MTIEEKATAYAENFPPVPSDDITYAIGCAYIAGATEALASMWKSTKEEIPDGNVKMLYILRDGRLDIGYFVNNDYQRYWMPIPELPTKGGEE